MTAVFLRECNWILWMPRVRHRSWRSPQFKVKGKICAKVCSDLHQRRPFLLTCRRFFRTTLQKKINMKVSAQSSWLIKFSVHQVVFFCVRLEQTPPLWCCIMSIFENVQGTNSFQKSGAGEMGDSITSGGEMFQFGGRLPDGPVRELRHWLRAPYRTLTTWWDRIRGPSPCRVVHHVLQHPFIHHFLAVTVALGAPVPRQNRWLVPVGNEAPVFHGSER